jgi:ketosteroid isomerase-like protein
MDATGVLERLQAAQNAHDVDALVACFEPDYASEQPRHPGRGFRGTEQVRTNWTALFGAFPDLEVEVLRHAVNPEDATVWSEWRWTGTGQDTDLAVVGVIVFGVRDDRIAWARLYMEPVEREDESIDAAVTTMTGTD